MEKVIEWNNMELVLSDFDKSHANGGRLGKFWVEDRKTGRVFLIKSSSTFHYEPYSEKIAYIVGKSLGMDILEYDILPAKLFKGMIPLNSFCKHVSICEKIDRKNYSITSVAEIKRARNAILDKDAKPITNREVMYELLSQKYIDTMILFDAIIGNEDRHYGNVHLLRGIDGEIVGAPILDNGASLLADRNSLLCFLMGMKVGKVVDKAFTIEKRHNDQMNYIETLKGISFNIPEKTIQILNEIQPTLDLMPRLRAIVVKRYLVYRLYKYLGLLKKGGYINQATRDGRDTSKIRRENEITTK